MKWRRGRGDRMGRKRRKGVGEEGNFRQKE